MTSVNVYNEQFVLQSLSIDEATGELTLLTTSQEVIPAYTTVKDSVVYAAQLCSSRDNEHTYAIYPVDNVSLAA